MTAVPFPEHLADGDVRLRRHRAEDVDDLLAQCTDPGMQRWTGVPVPYTRGDAEWFLGDRAPQWEAGTTWSLAVEHAGRFAGTVDLFARGPGAAEVGYGLAPWARGRRVLTRALRLVLPWAFDALDLDVVHWRANAGNWASRRAAWAVGFAVEEGHVRGLLTGRPEVTGGARREDGWIGSLLAGEPLAPRHPWYDAVPLAAGPVRLRALRDDDAGRLAQACADPAAQAWLPFLPAGFTVADGRARIEAARERAAAGTGVTWAVTGNDDVLVGEAGLYRLGGGEAEVGYLVHPGARGRGVAAAAARAVCAHALAPAADGGLGLRRLLLVAAAGNEPSLRVARSAGFAACGRETRAALLRDGSAVDLLRFERSA